MNYFPQTSLSSDIFHRLSEGDAPSFLHCEGNVEEGLNMPPISVFWTAVISFFSFTSMSSQMMTREVAQWAIAEFERLEPLRIITAGTDRRSSAPFITGDGFRDYCRPHICEEENRCRMTPESVRKGECIFVKSDFMDYFVKSVSARIKEPYVLVVHNGDLSAPDGQSDAPKIQMSKYVTSDILHKEYDSGRLIALHSQNLWWQNISRAVVRPSYAHCIPIGFEIRRHRIGSNVKLYANALREHVLNKPILSEEQKSRKPLLLVAFYPKSKSPDRYTVLQAIGAIPVKGAPKLANPFYNATDLSHAEWLQAIGEHRFVLAPFGHGLDTHRVSEILLMGGIPVMRKSGISSCYDNTDNEIRGFKRGGIPVVILNSWSELTKERLESEWKNITETPIANWDYRRLFLDHWLQRIGKPNVTSLR